MTKQREIKFRLNDLDIDEDGKGEDLLEVIGNIYENKELLKDK